MARVTVEDCLEQLDNRFALVLLVSKRAKQLLKGSNPVVSARNNKYIVNALREVAAGAVKFHIGGQEQDLAAMNLLIEKDLKK